MALKRFWAWLLMKHAVTSGPAWFLMMDNPIGRPQQKKGGQAIYKYDLDSRQLIKKYVIPQISDRHEFNDLTLCTSGDVYITDSHGAIYSIDHSTDELELWLKSELFASPNGITLSTNGKTLYMADWVVGLYCINKENKQVQPINVSQPVATCGIDGLYFWNNHLIAVQNGLDRVIQYELDQSGTRVEKAYILEANTNLMDMPTTGVVTQNSIYYICNPEVEEHALRDITIMRVPLKLN
jgi:hypothetical protein